MNETNTPGGEVMKQPMDELCRRINHFRKLFVATKNTVPFSFQTTVESLLTVIDELVSYSAHVEAELDAKTEVALSVGNDLFVYGSAAATEKCQGDLMAADGLGHMVDELTAERDALREEIRQLKAMLEEQM